MGGRAGGWVGGWVGGWRDRWEGGRARPSSDIQLAPTRAHPADTSAQNDVANQQIYPLAIVIESIGQRIHPLRGWTWGLGG